MNTCDLEEARHVALQAFWATPTDAWRQAYSQWCAEYKSWRVQVYTNVSDGQSRTSLHLKLDNINLLDKDYVGEETDIFRQKGEAIIKATNQKQKVDEDQEKCLAIQAALNPKSKQSMFYRFRKWLSDSGITE